MAVDHIRYDLLTQDAMRGVVRKVLADAAKNGLPGDHHFYVSFDTGAAGVKISPRLRAQYPEEITIVLQHQFWDFMVKDETFEVSLAFGGVPEKLVVPFVAIKGFFDPSVQFGLQFETDPDSEKTANNSKALAPKEETLPETAKLKPEAKSADVTSADKLEAKVQKASKQKAEQTDGDNAPEAQPSAEVVRLDRFRKK